MEGLWGQMAQGQGVQGGGTGTGMGLGTTHLSFTCQRKMVWGPQPGCSLRKFPSLQRGCRAGEKSVRRTALPKEHCLSRVCPSTHLVWKISVKSCSRKSTRELSLRISFTYTCTTTESGPFSYESFLTNARFTMDSGSTLRPQLSNTQDRF